MLLAAPLRAAPARPLPGAPYTWIYDVCDRASLPRAKAIGVNTIFLSLPEDITAEVLQEARDIAQACADLELRVVVGLPTTLSQGYRTALDNPRYVEAVAAYVHDVVPQLRDEPAVIGWATGDYLEKYLMPSDEGFRQYLVHKYGSLEGVSEVWQTNLSSVATVTQQNALSLDDRQAFGVGLPSVDLADYQAAQYRETMTLWARLIREASGGKGLLFTGRVTLYRSLPLIPEEYDVIVTSMPPELLERDWETHNVHSIDIARRGGRRHVMPCLRIPQPPDTEDLNVDKSDIRDYLYYENKLYDWMIEAAMHGACGLSFEAEPGVLDQAPIQRQLQKNLRRIADEPALLSHPRGAAAILYEPYADGFSALNVPVYGYVSGLSDREPSDLLNVFKRGTRYGPLDTLTLEDLPGADLSQYGVIFAPMALDLPETAQGKLAEYVLQGGALVADIGAGFVQTGSWQALPPRLAGLFGVARLVEVRNVAGNLTVSRPSPALPSVPGGAKTTGDFRGGAVSERLSAGPCAIHGWTAFAVPDSQAIPFARLAMGLAADKKPTFAGVVSRTVGTGVAFYATHRLWASWLPKHALFNEFHSDLWQRRAAVELLGGSFVTTRVELAENEDGSVTLYNPGDLRRLQLALYSAEHRLFSGCVCQFSAALTDAAGLRTGGVLVTVDAPRHASVKLIPVPVEIRPHAGVATASLDEYGKQAIRVTIAGAQSIPSGRPGEVAPSRGQPQPVRLTIRSGEYAIAPGSRHVLTAMHLGGNSEERELTADNRGRLIVDLQVERTQIEVRPRT